MRAKSFRKVSGDTDTTAEISVDIDVHHQACIRHRLAHLFVLT